MSEEAKFMAWWDATTHSLPHPARAFVTAHVVRRMMQLWEQGVAPDIAQKEFERLCDPKNSLQKF
jgi:hypothetical protein